MIGLESRIERLERAAVHPGRRFVVVRDVDDLGELPADYRPGVDDLVLIVGIDPDKGGDCELTT